MNTLTHENTQFGRIPINGVAVTADGWAVSASSGHNKLKVWDLKTGRELRTLEGGSSSVAVSSDGRRVVSAYGYKLKVWDLDTGRELRTLAGHSAAVLAVAVTADGRRAVSASDDNTLKVWDVETGQLLRTLSGHSTAVRGVALTGDGCRAVSASDDSLKVWNPETGTELRTLAGHSAVVNGVAVTADGRRAASASDDNTLKVWDLERAEPIATFIGDAVPTSCAFADDRTIFAGDQIGRVHLLALEFPPPR